MDEKDKRIRELEKEVRILKELVSALIAENAELKARLNKNSENSSKPPSSDGLKKTVKNSRVKTGNQSGGQPGHTGTTKNITPTPDTIIELKPQTHCECGGTIIIRTDNFTVRQVSDIQPVKVITVEYRAHDGDCESCGKTYKASYPKGVDATVTYGDNLQAMVTYLTNYQLIPLKRTTELVQDLFGLPISQGFIVNSNKEAYTNLESTETMLKETIIKSDVANFDESGMRVNGRGYWLHSASTETETVYSIHPKRGKEAMNDMGILPFFFGTAIHDHLKSYYHYLCAHGECNQHHIRHLQYLNENLQQTWAGEMIMLLIRIKRHVVLSRTFGAY
jgi:transposase